MKLRSGESGEYNVVTSARLEAINLATVAKLSSDTEAEMDTDQDRVAAYRSRAPAVPRR
ncbi:MAG TPA: hypothetical protein VFI48_04250 [Hyphomicrobiaceae bacterium]|nr:hypothetical protein [Hyphomicrobiaceae bacterium]